MPGACLTKGRIVANQYEVEWQPRSATDSVVILVRGYGSDAASWINNTLASQLAMADFAVLSHDFGSNNTWGADTCLTPMDSVVAYAEARWSRVFALAASMGGSDILNWIRRHPQRLKGACIIAGACKLDAIHDRGALAGAIESAYGGAAAYEAERPNRDPWLYTNVHTRDPLQLWYSGDDGTVIPTDVTEFATNCLKQPLHQGNVGHSFDGVDVNRVVEFFRSV